MLHEYLKHCLSTRVPSKQKRFVAVLLLLVVLAAFFLAGGLLPFSAAQPDEDLAATYSPVLHFAGAEKFYPVNVEYAIASSAVKQRVSAGSPTMVDSSPTPQGLNGYSLENLYLDNSFGTLDAIASDYTTKASSLGYTAYVHVANEGGSRVIQYWLFYAYNDGPLNNHEGDWEVVEVFLNGAGSPTQVLCSQHGSGENAVWSDVEKDQTHPVIYVAQGSHANFFRSYQGKIGIENDIVGADGKTIQPNELKLVLLSEPGSQPASQNWLQFTGRWGYWGTDQEVLLGMAGPYGPYYNQEGIRWAHPTKYLNQTFQVGGLYFVAALFVAYFLLLFLIYFAARAAWKVLGIVRLHRKGGLRVRRFLRGRGSIGLALGAAAIFLTIAAIALPWYTISASSQVGPLSQIGGTTLMTMDGVHGVVVNSFFAGLGSDATSGYMTLFSAQLPFAIIIAVGVVLLALDVIGVKSGKSIGKKLMLGMISTLLPLILIIVFVSMLPSLLPFAYGLFPGQAIPPQIANTIQAIAVSPIQGSGTSSMPIIGSTTVTWGLGIGAWLFVVAAILKLIGGIVMYTTPDLQSPQPQMYPPPMQNIPPPPTYEQPLVQK